MPPDDPDAAATRLTHRLLSTSRPLCAAVALLLGYLAAVYLGRGLSFDRTFGSTLWPPTAILLGTLLLTHPRDWVFLIAAALPAHLLAESLFGIPRLASIGSFLSGTAEAVLAASVIRRFLRGTLRFDRVRDVGVFVVAAGALAPMVTSVLDVALSGFGAAFPQQPWDAWRARTLSHSLAALTLVPVVVIGARGALRAMRDGAVGERTGMLTVIACVNLGLAVAAAAFALPGVPDGAVLMASVSGSTAGIQLFFILAAASFTLHAASFAELKQTRANAQVQSEQFDLALGVARMGAWEWDISRDRLTWHERRDRHARSRHAGHPDTFHELAAFLHPDDRGVVKHAIQHARSKRRHVDVEFRTRRPDGRYRWISVRGKALAGAPEAPARMIGVYSDISRRKLTEAQLDTQREQIARLNEASVLAEVSAALAHEVKQPLTAMLSNAQAARRELARARPDLREVDHILADIIAENRRTNEVIRHLRALFVRGELHVQPVDTQECIREVLEIEQNVLRANRVTVSVSIAQNLPPARIDRIQLQQVLINLVANACDAMLQNPPEDRHLEISSAAREGCIEIEIRDNGPGIRDTGRIFAPFYTTKADGLGLGLAICRKIVTAHDGQLWATNNPSRGATLHVVLPAATAGRGSVDRPGMVANGARSGWGDDGLPIVPRHAGSAFGRHSGELLTPPS